MHAIQQPELQRLIGGAGYHRNDKRKGAKASPDI
jgi:hypothetical protein